MTTHIKLLPEWHKQEAVVLAWPDEDTDWLPWLSDVQQTYSNIIKSITDNDTGVILLVRENLAGPLLHRFSHIKNLLLISANYDDTWCRDYGFLTCSDGNTNFPVEYTFNGWGNKFDARNDNQVNQKVLANLCQQPIKTYDLVMEGGAVEIDSLGNLLSTQLCLGNPERNGKLTMSEYYQWFRSSLGAQSIHIFEHGHLHGDDTDGHIDTLVRFTPNEGLVIQSSFNDANDVHFDGLSSLVTECKKAFPQHRIFELPLPKVFNDEGQRLPASYANLLITNNCVLCPTYRANEDELALEILGQAFAGMQIIEIDSFPLIQQFGSIHCITMQVPQHTLKQEVITCFGNSPVWLNEKPL